MVCGLLCSYGVSIPKESIPRCIQNRLSLGLGHQLLSSGTHHCLPQVILNTMMILGDCLKDAYRLTLPGTSIASSTTSNVGTGCEMLASFNLIQLAKSTRVRLGFSFILWEFFFPSS